MLPLPESLYGRLVVVMLAVLAIVASVQIALTVSSAQRYFQEITQDVNRDVASQVASRRDILVEGAFDEDQLRHLFSDLMTTHPSIEVYALDRAGRIVAFSAPPGTVVRDSVSLAPIRQFLAGARLPVLGDDPRAAAGQKVFSAAPVRSAPSEDASMAGFIYVVLEGQRYASAVERLHRSYILHQSALAVAASFVLALLVALYLLRRLTRHLRRLSDAMSAFEASGFTQTTPLTPSSGTGDEIDRLEGTFAIMATRMGDQLNQIRRADASRRQLLADVSHDLRTPLASLCGYLDTVLMKEGEMPPGQEREFLGIAARQAERLGFLIEDLLELARLDIPQMSLNREPLSMAELMQDALQKFALMAEHLSVRLERRLDPHLPRVMADVRLMARVVDNLLDNALRHSHGTVVASVTGIEGKVLVIIADEGCGIASADLPRIFERFVQVGKAPSTTDRNGTRRGLGLGLAIAKQILERHGIALTVESTVGIGTRFSFVL